MEAKLGEIIAGLGSTERSHVAENYQAELENWAKMIDEINSYETLSVLPENKINDYNEQQRQFDTLLQRVKALNIAQNSDSIRNLQSYVDSFRRSYYYPMLEFRNLLRVSTLDVKDIEDLRKTIANAKKEQQNFEKSFQESLQKQTTNSTRTLAAHFQKRLEDIKTNDETSPRKWLRKRSIWLTSLLSSILVLSGLYIVLVVCFGDMAKEYGIQIIIAKAAIIALFYIQYHFATKNYHIYADLAVKYEHMVVVSRTMTDFVAIAIDDEKLRQAVLDTAAKTLFAEVSTGHLKERRDSPTFENIINQLPGVKQ